MSRPAAPESPETDALLMQHLSSRSKWLGLGRESYREAAVRQVGALIDLARSLERRLSLAQTEIKGHMRGEDDLQAEVARLRVMVDECHGWLEDARRKAQARIAELEKDAARIDWVERYLCRAGEVKNDAGQTVKLARVWSIMGELETFRETVDAHIAALKSRA